MNNSQRPTIDLLDLIQVLWKNVLIIALVAMLIGSAVFGYTAFLMEPEYEATASMYVNNSSFNLGATSFSISTSDLNTSNSLVNVYLYILKSRTTMEEVIKAADLTYTPSELGKMITAKGVASTGAFEVTVTSTNPTEVELIANTIAKLLSDRIAEIVDGTSVRIVDYAIIPNQRSGPNILLNTIIGILAGAFLCMAVIVVRYLLNDTSREIIQTADDVRQMYPDIMVLAMIPDMRVSDKEGYYYAPIETKKEGKKNGRNQGA